jgi:hypothetical protein
VHQTLFNTERADVTVELRVSQRLIDIEELYVFICVVQFDRLPTGDVTQIRGSREAAERQHGVCALARQLSNVNGVALIVNDSEIGNLLAESGAGFIEAGTGSFCAGRSHALLCEHCAGLK